MTKQLTVFLIFTTFATLLQAQDIDFFHKNQNDKFKFEDINTQMSMDEYRILSRELRMKDMMYAAIVPGYVHFYAKDNKKGYSILALRSVAYGTLGYLSYKEKISFGKERFWQLNLTEDDIQKTDVYLTYGAVAVILGTYLYDWIHGQYILKKKQENIRYKYNMKMNLGMLDNHNGTPMPAFSLSLQF